MKMIKLLVKTILVCSFALLLIGCTKTDDPKDNQPTEDKCKLTLKYNQEGMEDEVIEYDYASIVTLPSKDIKNFLGWTYVNSDEIITDEFMIYADTVVIAKYKQEKTMDVLDLSTPTKQKNNYKLYKDITFKVVGDVELKLDIYYPTNDSDNKPVLFSYFGGGWIVGSKESEYYTLIYQKLLTEGFVIVKPNYRLCNGGVSFPSPVEDCLDAIRYIVKYKDVLKIDVNTMGSIGYSAGAHLALMAGFAQDHFKAYDELKDYDYKLKFVCDYFGPSYFDLDEFDLIGERGKIMLGSFLGTLTIDESYAVAFPSTYVTENKPNLLIVHSLSDDTVPPTQSIKFKQLCDENGIETSIILVEGATHMLDNNYKTSEDNPSLVQIFNMTVEYIKTQAGK